MKVTSRVRAMRTRLTDPKVQTKGTAIDPGMSMSPCGHGSLKWVCVCLVQSGTGLQIAIPTRKRCILRGRGES